MNKKQTIFALVIGALICLTLCSCGFNYSYFLNQGKYDNAQK